jgi:diketogulonate reductase-like aldo/keto reductase
MIRLSNGIDLPSIGIGTFKATGEAVQAAVKAAVQCGITHIDTAAIYKVRQLPARQSKEHVGILKLCWKGSSKQGGRSTAAIPMR